MGRWAETGALAGELLCVEEIYGLRYACISPVGGVQVVAGATGWQAMVDDIGPTLRSRASLVFGLGHTAVPRVCMAVHSALADSVVRVR